jgi:hypothetical protein
MERASLPPPPGLRRDQCEADLERRAKATADKLSSKLTTRSEGVLEYWSTVPVFELHLATARLGMLKAQ